LKKDISIIISCFNHSKYLNECLYSIFNNKINEKFYDVIFIDDASTDNSLEIAEKFKKNKNFFILKNKKNIGLVKSCNKAIKFSNSKFIIRIDSDDYVSKNFIKRFHDEIKRNKYDFIYCDRIEFFVRTKKRIKVIINHFDLFKMISCGVALRGKIIRNIGYYKNLKWEEYDLYIRYFKKTKKIKRIKNILYYYRKHSSNMTKKNEWKKQAWSQLIKKHGKEIIKKYEDSCNWR
jgi:glycosyltransferase involved in cell wall biosynthesis|tara:strand:+ start:869 stop:1570 length:702 start_codon:yes stop_codon:yes gene_type:complete